MIMFATLLRFRDIGPGLAVLVVLAPFLCMRSFGADPEWVDILPWAEQADWAARGYDWNQNLESPPGQKGVRIKSVPSLEYPLPAIIDGDYDMQVDWMRVEGSEAVFIGFPVGPHTMQLVLSSHTGRFAVVHSIDGQPAEKNPTYKSPSSISNGRRYLTTFHVRVQGTKASFHIDHDGTKDYIVWEGPLSSLEGGYQMMQHPWVGSWGSRTWFQAVRVRMLTGQLTRDTITEADRETDLKNGFVRLTGVKPALPKVGKGQFLINQTYYERGIGEERSVPMVAQEFSFCKDFYYAHAPSRVKLSVPNGSKSFSVIGTNQASRSTRFQLVVDGVEAYDSGRAGMAIIKIDLPAGSKQLELVVADVDGKAGDFSYWCYPRFHRDSATDLTDKDLEAGTYRMKPLSAEVGHGQFLRNRTDAPPPVYYRDQKICDEFLFAHAPSSLTYAVPEGMSRFKAIGYCDVTPAVRYEVWADARQIYQSPLGGIIPIDVKIPSGTKSLELRTERTAKVDYTQTYWCYPRLYAK